VKAKLKLPNITGLDGAPKRQSTKTNKQKGVDFSVASCPVLVLMTMFLIEKECRRRPLTDSQVIN
jgi:hypothetical protein